MDRIINNLDKRHSINMLDERKYILNTLLIEYLSTYYILASSIDTVYLTSK